MNAIDNYGDFDLPEEKIGIEIIENSFNTIINCYHQFKAVIEKNKDDLYREDLVYENAEKLFLGKENLQIKDDEIKYLLNAIKIHTYPNDRTGLFLSALHNKTLTDILFIDEFKDEWFGYKLGEGKTLVIGSKTKAGLLGKLAKGNIINYGDISMCGYDSFKGLQINFGDIWKQGLRSSGGVQINYNKLSFIRPNNALNINKNSQPDLSNKKNSTKNLPPDILWQMGDYGGTPILEYNIYYKNTVIDTNQPLLNNIKQKMDEKLKDLEILKSLNNSPCDEIIKYIRKINFQKLEKELIKIADEIKEKYELIHTK